MGGAVGVFEDCGVLGGGRNCSCHFWGGWNFLGWIWDVGDEGMSVDISASKWVER